MKRYIYLIICLVTCVCLLVSCSTQKLPCKPADAPMAVTINIIGTDKTQILPQTEVGIFEGNTVLEVLQYVIKENDIQLEYSGLGKTAYIKGIDNLYEFDYGPASGWMYAINDADNKPMVSCGAYQLKDSDQITWIYVTEAR